MIDLEAIKARLASVGQTPWEKEVHTHADLGESQPITYLREGRKVVAEGVDDSLVDFLLHARQDMQDLIAEIEALQKFRQQVKNGGPGKYSDIVSDGGMDPRG